MKQDWSRLYFGRVTRDEIQEAVADPEWQKLREEMKSCDLETKYQMLYGYYLKTLEKLSRTILSGGYAHLPANAFLHDRRMLEVRCTNYVTALARGGLIENEDYCDV